MSTTTPTPYVPYQAYKSKRHSRVLSNPTVPAEALPNGIVIPQDRTRHTPSSSFDSTTRVNGESKAKIVAALGDDVAPSNGNDRDTPSPFSKSSPGPSSRPVSIVIVPESSTKDVDVRLGSESTSPTNTLSSVTGVRLNGDSATSDASTEPSSPAGSVQSTSTASHGPSVFSFSGVDGKPSTNAKLSEKSAGKAPAVFTEAGPSSLPSSPTSVKSAFEHPRTRRTSTFRYVPLRPPNASSSSTPRTSSPLRPTAPQAHSHSRTSSISGLSPHSSSRQLGEQPPPLQTASRSPASIHSDLTPDASQSTLMNPAIRNIHNNTHHRSASMVVSPSISPQPHPRPSMQPPQRTSSLPPAPAPPPKPVSPSLSPSPGPGPSPASQPISVTSSRVQSPSPMPQSTRPFSASSSTSVPSTPTLSGAHKTVYRPGFQPKGVYRPLTDDFLALRKSARDRGRIEQTRLERRFEKLVDLHFNPDKAEGEASGKEKRNSISGIMAPGLSRRASSFFEELGELKGKSAGELWKSVLESRIAAANGGKGDVRSAEQRITPWQDDAEVSACPLCSASFHPLTNRKHHCRLCGRIICSLPVKKPQRPVPCSLLFVSDPKTGRIEEVTEGVDYGVRPRQRVDSKVGRNAGNAGSNEEKFLKGVRICRECKPVMLRQQYRQEAKRVPAIARLYEALVSLESEIEETLPQFQELVLSLSNNPDEAPTKEASAARKHLLECFEDYDAIAKRIRKIPCPGGPGSSQERVQSAIVARANMFLQKNMFPLQSLPKPKRRSSSNANGDASGTDGAPSQVIDPDSELARVLQPLLEQEALLESFVEEATTHRKFEDARTLKANLAEIRAEIDRIVIQADGGA